MVSIMGDTVCSMSIDLGFKSVVSNRYYTVLTVGRWAWWLLSVMNCVNTYLSNSFVQIIEVLYFIPSHFPFCLRKEVHRNFCVEDLSARSK